MSNSSFNMVILLIAILILFGCIFQKIEDSHRPTAKEEELNAVWIEMEKLRSQIEFHHNNEGKHYKRKTEFVEF